MPPPGDRVAPEEAADGAAPEANSESGAGGGAERAWRRSLRLIGALLVVWFTVSLGLGVLFAAPLNRIWFFGFPLGFWFAQQGAILVFLALLVIYAAAMDRLERDRSPDRDGDRAPADDAGGPPATDAGSGGSR